MKQKVIIIGHSFTSRLGIIRSVAEIGCEVTVVVMAWNNKITKRLDKSTPIDCHSKYVNHVYYCYINDGEGLIRLLLEKCADSKHKSIIIPDSDFAAVVVDKHQDKLKDYFLYPHINYTAGAVEHWMNKAVQKQLAREVGLNVANANIVKIENGKYIVPKAISYPCFTKATATISGGKQFFRRCDNEETLRQLLDKVSSRLDTEILVEDFKKIDEEYAVVGFSDGKNVVIPGVIKFIATSQSHLGIARQGKITSISGFEETIELFKTFVRKIGFYGLFDIDFFQSNGLLYFVEMNLRFGGSGYAVTKMGVNLPGMFVKSICGEPYSDMNQFVTSSAVYVNERMCMDDWYLGHITLKECHQYIDNADITFVGDTDDPNPNRSMRKVFLFTKFKKIIRNIIKK